MKKMKATYSVLLLTAMTFSAIAQKVEIDDMYFTAKDRVKVKAVVVPASKPSAQQENVQKGEPAADATLNPTDSYSARNVNPDYNSGKPNAPKADYFVEDYRPTGVNGSLNGNYSTSSPNSQYSYYNNNPYAHNPYSSFGMGLGYSGMSSMGGMYPMDPYGMSSFGYPYSPYSYGSSMMMSYGMSFGYNPWMYNGMAYGFGSPWSNGMYGMYDPFMMSSMYCPYSFYGYNSAYSSYYPTAVDNNQNGRNVAYGRRSERSTSEQFQSNETRPSVTQSRTGRTVANGRTRSTDGTQAYYERGWKNNTNTSTGSTERATRSFWTSPSQNSDSQPANSANRWSNSGRSNNGSSWGSSSWDNNSNSGSNWSSGGNRSSWSGGSSSGISSGGGTRSSGGSTSGGSTRGRD